MSFARIVITPLCSQVTILVPIESANIMGWLHTACFRISNLEDPIFAENYDQQSVKARSLLL